MGRFFLSHFIPLFENHLSSEMVQRMLCNHLLERFFNPTWPADSAKFKLIQNTKMKNLFINYKKGRNYYKYKSIFLITWIKKIFLGSSFLISQGSGDLSY